MREILLLGAGKKRRLEFILGQDDVRITTLDINSAHSPDILADLEILPYDWAEKNKYDEIHAYELLEHTGAMGDYKFFFAQFSEFHRILKPGGYFAASVPAFYSEWALGDPGHRRVINHGSLTFLTQEHYEKGVGNTAMSDYRDIYKVDFQIIRQEYEGPLFKFVLRAQ